MTGGLFFPLFFDVITAKRFLEKFLWSIKIMRYVFIPTLGDLTFFNVLRVM